MGQGGEVVIINATKYPFQLQNAKGGYQMNSWSLPSTIAPGTSSGRIYIEFSQALGDTITDDAGNATYMIADGANNPTFQVQARVPEVSEFVVELQCLTVDLSNTGFDPIILQQMDSNENSDDWDCAKVVIAGTSTSEFYIGTNPPTDWMATVYSDFQNRKLRQLCLPGSHDSGMSVTAHSTLWSNPSNTQTQTLTIGQQLAAGIRYFDIRASLFGSTYGTAHFSHVTAIDSWQGTFGQTMNDIIEEVNAFTANNAELIIFDISHGYDLTGYEDNNVTDFTKDQYTGLMQLLKQVNNRCTAIKDLDTDASEAKLKDFIGNNQASVLFVMRDTVAVLTDFAGQGFIQGSQLPLFNVYTDSDQLDAVVQDQIMKLGQQRISPDSPMFLAAWIETLTSFGDNTGGNILANTVNLNNALFQELWNACTTSSYPNVLQADGVDSTVTALAIAMNYVFGPSS
ncbi:hypothetical protein FSHL1_000167 [Fusarium sambucinum]